MTSIWPSWNNVDRSPAVHCVHEPTLRRERGNQSQCLVDGRPLFRGHVHIVSYPLLGHRHCSTLTNVIASNAQHLWKQNSLYADTEIISLPLFSSSTIFPATLIWTHAFSRLRNCTFNWPLIVIFPHPLQKFLVFSVARVARFLPRRTARHSRLKSTLNNRVERWTWTTHSFAKSPNHH